MNILRRLPLSRLLLLCGLVVAIGVSATALALAFGSGPTPPARPLAQAVHDALAAPVAQGVSADVTLTNHLLEGASLAGAASGNGEGGGLSSSPLVNGGSGRLWISSDGRLRLELQSEKGDTEVIYDGHTLSVYDAASNTVYRYTPPARETTGAGEGEHGKAQAPTVAAVEEAIDHIDRHARLSGATPTDVAGQPAYTVRLSPRESGSLLGGAELSFDADNGAPLRAALYSSQTSTPVIELAATQISFGPVSPSVFEISPPPGAKVEQLSTPAGGGAHRKGASGERPKVTVHGHGVTAIAVLEAREHGGKGGAAGSLEGLPTVSLGNGVTASELRTELGTVLSFERAGVRYVVGGALATGPIEALARGL